MSTNDEYESMRLYNYNLGFAASFEHLSEEFAEKSGRFFANRQDDNAAIYRSLSDDFKKRAKAYREEMNKYKDQPESEE
jgi:hypothetical protein